jgi:uncharacterized protein
MLCRRARIRFPIDQSGVERAKQIILGHPHFSARHAIHLAVMQQQKVTRILTFDVGFDRFPLIERLR